MYPKSGGVSQEGHQCEAWEDASIKDFSLKSPKASSMKTVSNAFSKYNHSKYKIVSSAFSKYNHSKYKIVSSVLEVYP